MPKRLANRDELVEWLQPLDGVRAIMAVGEYGATAGASGTSADVSDQDDRVVLLAARTVADVAFTGGETARVESYKPSAHVAIAILTRNADSVADVPAVQSPGLMGTKVFGGGSNESLERAIQDAITTLRGDGFERILFEGGLNLLQAAIQAGAIDELLLTATGGIEQVPLVANLFEADWHLVETANFGSRWLYKLAK